MFVLRYKSVIIRLRNETVKIQPRGTNNRTEMEITSKTKILGYVSLALFAFMCIHNTYIYTIYYIFMCVLYTADTYTNPEFLRRFRSNLKFHFLGIHDQRKKILKQWEILRF